MMCGRIGGREDAGARRGAGREGREGRGLSEGKEEREDGEGGRVHIEKAGEEERDADRGDVRALFGEPGVGDDGEGQEQHGSFRALETRLQ